MCSQHAFAWCFLDYTSTMVSSVHRCACVPRDVLWPNMLREQWYHQHLASSSASIVTMMCLIWFCVVFVRCCFRVCLFVRLFALRLLAGYPQLNNIIQVANTLLFCRFSAVARCSYIEIIDVRVHGIVCLVLGKTAPRSRTRVSATIGITSPASVRFARW